MLLLRPIAQGVTYRRMAYLALAFPLGVTYFTFLVTGISLGFGLAILWVGFPILLGMMLTWRSIGTFERGLHRVFLDIDIPEPVTTIRGEGPLWFRTRALLRDWSTWRTLLWLFFRFPAGIATFVLLTVMFSVGGAFVASPIFTALNADWLVINDRALGTLDLLWMVPAGVVLLISAFHVANGLAWIHGVVGTTLLGPSVHERHARLQTRATEAETRTRLAHELHDSIGHAVTLMVVQAGAGRKVFDTDPEFAKESLAIIEKTGRSSLGELDRVLGILRDDDSGGIDPPAPDLSDLDDLVESVREAGLPVQLSVTGDLWVLPKDVQTAAYRVAQEAVTNVMRHAHTSTTVRVELLPNGLTVEVVNEPPNVAPTRRPGNGRGIAGIRERAAAYGGSSEIGPTISGGYRVWVRFPLL